MQYDNKLPEITLKYKKGTVEKITITSSEDSYKAFLKLFDSDTLEINEQFIVMFLNRANKTIGWYKHSSGGSVATVVDVKLLIATALGCGCQAMIVAHNHPSGNAKPSGPDMQVSKKIKAACEIFDISFLDNLIITETEYFSFADEGII